MKAIMDFEEYLELTEKISKQDTSILAEYPKIPFEYMHSNALYFNEIFSSVQLHKKVYNYLSELETHLKWTLITEPWCGDAAFSSPYIIMMAQSAEHINLKIALRDKNEHLINQHLNNGGKSIPILVCYDAQDNFLFRWGPRPAACQTLVNDLPKEISLSEKIEKIVDWYKKDAGEQVQLEIFELLKTIK